MNLKVVIYYIIVLLILNSSLYWSLINLNPAIVVISLAFCIFLLLPYCFKNFKNIKYPWAIILYSLSLIATVFINDNISIHSILRFIAPLAIISSISGDDYKKVKGIYYLLSLFFVANCFLGLYERITMTHVLGVMDNDDVMEGQLGGMIYTYGEYGFRAFSLLGHPLTNANVMAFMSVLLYYSNEKLKYLKYAFLFLGYASLFAFNTRGAILIMSLLVLCILFEKFGKSNHKFFFLLFTLIAVYYIISNFDSIGGRLASGGIEDDSSMVRVAAIYEFLSLSGTEFLFGGHVPIYGENGYLMTIEVYGIIIGGVKILFEMIYPYKIINRNTKPKVIVLSSIILIGSTNNNLYYSTVFPLFMISLIFIYFFSEKNYRI